MKLLLDENLSRRIIPFLQENYAGSTQVVLVGLERADDKTVWKYAKKHDFTIVTKDSDFYELSLVFGYPPKIIWIKSGNTTKESIIQLLNDNKEKISALSLDKDISCIELY